MTYERLAQPIRVGSMELKNRIIMVAMHHVYTPGGTITPRFCEYYWTRAAGGAAMITIGACRFDPYGARESTLKLDCEEDIPSHAALVKGMQERGCKVALQLYHAGRYMRREEVQADDEAIAPSAVYTSFTRQTARPMTQTDIDRTIAAWALAAKRAKQAGYDAVEISGSAGYLITQFLSPVANVRTDEYGGSFENRCRFPLAVIAAVREAVGPDYPLILRLGGHDLVPGSNESADCLAFAKLLPDAGVDMINLTGGWHESRIPQLTGEMPPAGLVHLAREIRKAVDIPVAMANRMGDPVVAETSLALGWCDIAAMGRPLIAEPALPNKIFSGLDRLVQPCVSCNQGCLAGTFFDKPVRCLVNGLAGREAELDQTPAVKPQRLLVVGGGPAGCAFAIQAAKRGHWVTLWEKSDGLGGQIRLYAQLPVRKAFGKLLDYFNAALADAGVQVELGREADADSILGGGFDQVIFACGRSYKQLPVPVSPDAPPVYTPTAYLTEKPVLGRRVAIIGGSFVGMEIGRTLAMTGSLDPDRLFYLMRYGIESDETLHQMLKTTDRQVAIFEKGKLGAGYENGVAWTTFGDLNAFGAELYKNTTVLEINAQGVVTQDFTWPCDAVILAVGTRAEDGLYEQLKDLVPCHKIGNLQRPGRVIDAVAAGTELGCRL